MIRGQAGHLLFGIRHLPLPFDMEISHPLESCQADLWSKNPRAGCSRPQVGTRSLLRSPLAMDAYTCPTHRLWRIEDSTDIRWKTLHPHDEEQIAVSLARQDPLGRWQRITFRADCELSQERGAGCDEGRGACGSASGGLGAGRPVGAGGGDLLRANLVVPLRQGRASPCLVVCGVFRLCS